MSCFVCFESAHDGEADKPAAADAKDSRKDGPPDRGVVRVGSGAPVYQTGSGNCLFLAYLLRRAGGLELCGVRLGRLLFSLAAREP